MASLSDLDGQKHQMLVCKFCQAFPKRDQSVYGSKISTGLLRCGACKWAEYCNANCQKADWADHKATCKAIKTGIGDGSKLSDILTKLSLGDSSPSELLSSKQFLAGTPSFSTMYKRPSSFKAPPISLESFWPIFAAASGFARARSDFPLHIAFQHQVSKVETEKNGETLVHLGKKMTLTADQNEWYPGGKKDVMARSSLFRRITSDYWNLESSLGLALSIEKWVYDYAETCLTYQGKDVVDFGVCAGSARVVGEDRINYRLNGKRIAGADPKDHYWLYFSISTGETTYVDLNLFVWNFRMGVDLTSYLPLRQRAIDQVPGLCFGKFSIMSATHLHTEREPRSRFSVLCNEDSGWLCDSFAYGGGISDKGRKLYTAAYKVLKGGKKEANMEDSLKATSAFLWQGAIILREVMESGRSRQMPTMDSPNLVIIDASQEK